MDKEDGVCVCIYIYTHTHNVILLSYKQEWNNAICSNMYGPRDYHTKWSQSEREQQTLYNVTYMWNIKYDTNLFTKEKQTHRYRRQIYQRRKDRER